MSESAAVSIIISIFAILVSSALIMTGWGVIYKNAKKLASRNELFNRKTRIIQKVLDISDSAIDFWGREHHKEHKKEYLLKTSVFVHGIDSLKKQINNISEFKSIDTEELIRDFRSYITLDAERPYELDTADIDDKIALIINSSDEICNSIRQVFNKVKPD